MPILCFCLNSFSLSLEFPSPFLYVYRVQSHHCLAQLNKSSSSGCCPPPPPLSFCERHQRGASSLCNNINTCLLSKACRLFPWTLSWIAFVLCMHALKRYHTEIREHSWVCEDDLCCRMWIWSVTASYWWERDHRVCAKWAACSTVEVFMGANSHHWRRDRSASRCGLFAEGTPNTDGWWRTVMGTCLFP